MNENQMEVLIHSNGYEKGGDLLSFSPNESSSENDHQTNSDTLAVGLAIVDDIWNTGEVAKNSELVDKHSKNDKDEICTSPKPVPSVILEEFNPCNEQKRDESETPSSCISGLLEPDVSMYTDKNVVECEMPELGVPGGVHVVKDICVDTGAVPQERKLIESDKDDHDGVFESINGDQDSNSFANWETFQSMEVDESRNFQEENVDENSSGLFRTRTVPKMDEQQSICSSDISIVSEEESSSISSTRVSGEFIMQESLLNSLKQEDDKVGLQSDEVPSLDTIMESLAVMFNSKDIKKEDQMSKLSYNSKVEKGTITFDFKSSKPDVPYFEENDTNAELVNGKSTEPLDAKEKTKDQSVSKDVEITNSTISTRIEGLHPQAESVNGESSFSVTEPVSGLITYSGQIANAGSTSIRSDSSTTSTRSFAFPVLQSEWNSSPVRMQKAAPRRRRNHWHGYLCCRF